VSTSTSATRAWPVWHDFPSPSRQAAPLIRHARS